MQPIQSWQAVKVVLVYLRCPFQLNVLNSATWASQRSAHEHIIIWTVLGDCVLDRVCCVLRELYNSIITVVVIHVSDRSVWTDVTVVNGGIEHIFCLWVREKTQACELCKGNLQTSVSVALMFEQGHGKSCLLHV